MLRDISQVCQLVPSPQLCQVEADRSKKEETRAVDKMEKTTRVKYAGRRYRTGDINLLK